MRAPVSWIREYADLPADLGTVELARRLTALGLKLEKLERPGAEIGGSLVLVVETPVTLDSAPRGVGCAYYEATLRELLRLVAVGGGHVEHVRCAGRGEGACEWRAEWR